MDKTVLLNSEIEVSALTVGCWAMAGGELWGEQDEADAIASVEAALGLGINSFDTAEVYGEGLSEEILGKAFKGKRGQAVIASKVWPTNMSVAGIREACEQSLKRLQTDYLDLYQLHWCPRDYSLADAWGVLEQLKDEGKVRCIGVSNFGKVDLVELLELGLPSFNQLPYNLLARSIEYEVLPICVDKQIDVFCYCPIMQGLLAGKFATVDDVPEGRQRTRHFSTERELARHGEAGHEALTFATIDKIRKIADEAGVPMGNMAMRWLMRQAGVSSVIIGIRNVSQVERAAECMAMTLSDDVVDALTEATEELKAALGTNPDMWMGGEESRYR